MNNPQARLRSSNRVVPPDIELQFGYLPKAGIAFDDVATLLEFRHDGTPKLNVGSEGVFVSDDEALVVGHLEKIQAGDTTPEVQVLGTGAPDSKILTGRFSANGSAPTHDFVKGRGGIGDVDAVVTGDALGFLRFYGADGTDLQTLGAAISVESIGTIGTGRVPTRMKLQTGTDSASTVLTDALTLTQDQDVLVPNGSLLIGETVNANMSAGITVNQGASDDESLALKSSDVAHGRTTQTETDTYFRARKSNSAYGGVNLEAFMDQPAGTAVLRFRAVTGYSAAGHNTTKSASANGVMTFEAYEGDNGGTTIQSIAQSNANLFNFRNGGSGGAVFIIDADGDYHYDGTGSAYDAHDDISLVRSIDLEYSADVVDSEWDRFVGHNKSDLARLGIVHESGFVSGKKLAKLHNGAIWQLNEKHMTLSRHVESLTQQLEETNQKLAALTA